MMVLSTQILVRHLKCIAVILIAILILIYRKPDSLSNPQLWAEDGPIFFVQQYENGAASIMIDYANYLHVVPRLIALFAASFFSYAAIPAVYTYSAFVITLIVIGQCFSPRLILPHKPLLALSIVLVPQSLNEVFLNITNLQWILCLLLILTLLKGAPAARYGRVMFQRIADGMVLVFAGLTGPFLILMSPWFGWKFYRLKSTYGYLMLCLTSIVVFIQLLSMTPILAQMGEHSLVNPEIYAAIFGRKLFGGLFFGNSMMYSNSLFIGFSALAFFGTLLYLSSTHSSGEKHCFRTITRVLAISLMILGAVILKYGFSPEIIAMPSGCRYFYIPFVMVAWSLVLCLNQREVWKNIFVITSLLLILYSSFATGLQTRLVDYHWSYHSQFIGTQPVVTIPINPNWTITLHSKK